MKASDSQEEGVAALLVTSILEEENLITELVTATREGDPGRALVACGQIAALRSRQEAEASKLAPPRD